MKKIISTLKELGNLVTLHFMWVDWAYKLDIYPSQNIDTKVTQHYYKEILPQQLFELSEQLNSDLTLIVFKDSAIYNKIRTNIDKLQESERERFIFSLLQPFGEYCNIRVDSGKFKDLITTATKKLFQRNIESSLLGLMSIIQTFFTTLDAILLERGINLLWYQEMSGIYLIEERDKRDYIEYLGSEKLVQRYIDEALPKLEPQQVPEPTNTKPQQGKLPDELNTDEALKYFAKAKEIGLIDDNYTWLKGKQLLACFCRDMSFKLDLGKGGRISWQPFEILFKTKKGSLRSNLNDIQKTGEAPTDIYLVDKVFK